MVFAEWQILIFSYFLPRRCIALHACPCGFYGDPVKACNCSVGVVTTFVKAKLLPGEDNDIENHPGQMLRQFSAVPTCAWWKCVILELNEYSRAVNAKFVKHKVEQIE